VPRKPQPKPTPRKRRTANDARATILDAAEKRLVASGPAGIRLQEVAADVGVSHPTVLHHFGSREGLVEAVVTRALDSLHAALLEALQAPPEGPDQIDAILDACFDALANRGHGRALLWLSLSGHAPATEELRVRSLADVVHEVRRQRYAEAGRASPPFEDTYFTVLLPALTLIAMSATAREGDAANEEPCGPVHFRRWLGRLIHHHLTAGPQDAAARPRRSTSRPRAR
jgi:AcrR family transcriptional regulator